LTNRIGPVRRRRAVACRNRRGDRERIAIRRNRRCPAGAGRRRRSRHPADRPSPPWRSVRLTSQPRNAPPRATCRSEASQRAPGARGLSRDPNGRVWPAHAANERAYVVARSDTERRIWLRAVHVHQRTAS